MRKRAIAALLILFCIVTALALPVAAAGTGTATSGKSRLTLQYSKNLSLPDVTFDLYKVGTYDAGPNTDGAYDFTATNEFLGAQAKLTGLKFQSGDNYSKEMTGLIETLVKYVDETAGISGVSGTTSSEGSAIFANLEQGLYLVRGETKTIDGTTYIPQSFLIPLPYPTADGGFSYKVTANVKHENRVGIKVYVETVWYDENGKLVKDHPPITVQLNSGDSKVLDSSRESSLVWEKEYSSGWENWKVTGDVPAGWRLVNEVKETEGNGIDGYTIKVIFTYRRIADLTVTKVWVDGNEKHLNDSVIANLFCTECEESKEATLNATNEWTHTWKDLDPGHKWMVIEKEVPSGYMATVSQNGNEFTITNTPDGGGGPTYDYITVKKVWVGSNNRFPVKVKLLRDGEVFDEQELNAGNGWSKTWETTVAGHIWEAVEVTTLPDGWTSSSQWNGNTCTITNKFELSPDDPDDPSAPPDNPDDPDDPSAPPDNPDDPDGPSAPPDNPDDPDDPSGPSAPPNDPPDDPSGPGLPQTGQFWWPVPLLAAAGVLLLLIGAVLFTRKEEPRE